MRYLLLLLLPITAGAQSYQCDRDEDAAGFVLRCIAGTDTGHEQPDDGHTVPDDGHGEPDDGHGDPGHGDEPAPDDGHGDEPTPDPTPQPDPPPPGPIPTGWPAEVPVPWEGWDTLPDSYRQVAVGANDQNLSCSNEAIRYVGGGNDGVIRVTANNCVIVFDITGSTVRITGNQYVVRDSDLNGNAVSTKNGLTLSGTNAVALNSRSHHMGGQDRHCFSAGENARNIWLVRNEGFYCSGDGFQAGHQLSAARPTNIYIVQNSFHENRENGLDYKYLTNVISAENQIWGHRPAPSDRNWCMPDRPTACWFQNSGSDGQAIVVGSDGDPIDVAFYRDEIFDNYGCFRIEDSSGYVIIDGVTCRDTVSLSGEQRAAGIQLDKSGMDIRVTDSLFQNVGIGIRQNWRNFFSFSVDGTRFTGIPSPVIQIESGEVARRSSLTNSVFDVGATIDWNGVTSPEAVSGTNTRQ